MGIITPKKNLPPEMDITEQARRNAAQRKAKMVEDLAEKMTEPVKDIILQSEISIGDYKSVMQMLNEKLANWFNDEINDRKLVDVIKPEKPEPEPEAEIPQPAEG